MNIWKKFKVAIYLRLSKEDDDFKEESASITNQRNFLMNFIRANDNFIFMCEYVDDGFSGGDFERPEFKRLMQDIQAGKIDCVIVKDQSRFGRNDLCSYRFFDVYR
jgi:DNA invertase Pin-like site-specific DNA recombinase